MPHNYANAYVGNSLLRPADVRPVPFGALDDTHIGLLVRYVGSQVSGTIEVDAAGDLFFKHGALGAEVADTTVSTDGQIDVSGATEDTFGEVVDMINASANWEAVLVDVPRAASSNDALLIRAASQAKVPAGVPLVLDTSTALRVGRLIAPDAYRTDIRTYEKKGVVDPNFPFIGFRAALIRATGLSTYASGTSFWNLVSENASTKVATTVWNVAAGATTAQNTIDFSAGEQLSKQGERLILSIVNSAAMASTQIYGQGVFYRSLD